MISWTTRYGGILITSAILPDNDAPGLEHARIVAASLYGTADQIKIVKLPGLTTKGDVSDWLADGGTHAELVRICEAALVFEVTSGSLYSSRHFPAPPGLQVAIRPSSTRRFASFSPSTTKTGLGLACKISGRL